MLALCPDFKLGSLHFPSTLLGGREGGEEVGGGGGGGSALCLERRIKPAALKPIPAPRVIGTE